MYELHYKDRETNKTRVFLLMAKSLDEADRKMRSVFEELRNTSLIRGKEIKLKN